MLLLGKMYELGTGVEENSKIAQEYYSKVCSAGIQKGCDEYKALKVKGL